MGGKRIAPRFQGPPFCAVGYLTKALDFPESVFLGVLVDVSFLLLNLPIKQEPFKLSRTQPVLLLLMRVSFAFSLASNILASPMNSSMPHKFKSNGTRLEVARIRD